MGQLQTFSNYFLVCGGVQTDPCISFLQNGIEPKCLYLGVPPSGNNRKIYPRFCQSLHERALSNICDDDKTAHFSFTHASWSNAVNFIVLVPNFLVSGKTPALYVKYGGKSQLGNQLWLNMESHPRCQASLTKPHAVHAHHSCISELDRGDVAGGIQCPRFLIYSHKELDTPPRCPQAISLTGIDQEVSSMV